MSGEGRRKRAHFAVERLSCKAVVDQMLAAGHTLDEILQAVREAGEAVGRTSIWRYANSWERTAERYRRAREQASVLVDAIKSGGPNTDMAEVANSLLMQGLVERLAETDPEEFKDLSIGQIGKVVAALERSAVARERLKLQFSRGVDAAAAQLKEQLRLELGQNPQLLEQLYRITDQAAEAAKAAVA